MSGRMLQRLCIALSTLLSVSTVQASGVERFHAFVKSTSSARADFEQKVHDRTGKLVQESKGSFAFQRPGRFRWTYLKPHPQLVVGDGEKVWIHDADLNQVTVRRMSRALGSTPAELLAGSADVDLAFVLTDAGAKDGLEWLEAKPRERDSGFENIRIGLGVAGIDTMELLDHFGQKTTLRFTGMTRNPKLEPSIFIFTPPKGADVLGE